MLSRTEVAVNRRGMLGPKIAALLRSAMAFARDQAEGPENERFGGDPAMVSGLERTVQHVSSCYRRLITPSRLILPAHPDS